MPNRRRRKLSTAMSAVAALAVASPCAYFLVYESTAGSKPAEHHEFKKAAVMSDLPGELMGALSQGLSQFGINLPPVPALSGTGTSTPGLTSPGLGSPGLTSPGLTSPGSDEPGPHQPGPDQPWFDQPGPHQPGPGEPGAAAHDARGHHARCGAHHAGCGTQPGAFQPRADQPGWSLTRCGQPHPLAQRGADRLTDRIGPGCRRHLPDPR